MKILLFWSFYEKYAKQVYDANPGLENQSYQQQLDMLLRDGFGWNPTLVQHMTHDGHEVKVLLVNVQPLQRTWARENGINFTDNWQHEVAYAQVKGFQPDIFWMTPLPRFFGEYLQSLRPFCRKIFVWIASETPSGLNLNGIDCILTSHRNIQENFQRQGIPSEKVLPAFDPRIASRISADTRDIECSFVGNLSWAHIQRIRVMKQLAEQTPIQIWGDRPRLRSRGLLKKGFLPAYLEANSLRSRVRPSVWALDMYKILARSQMTVNVHCELAGGLAGNMRMMEAPGMGALLLTEDAANIRELYEPGEEVITYRDTKHLIDLINYYEQHPQERQEIALAGQRKALAAHTVPVRSRQVLTIFEAYLRNESRTMLSLIES
jgi:spore maturation protein CgeB